MTEPRRAAGLLLVAVACLCGGASACLIYRLDESGRRALFVARYEAQRRGAAAIDTEHLLLGVLQADPRLCQGIAQQTGFDLATLLKRIDEASPPRAQTQGDSVDMPLSPAANEALSIASDRMSPGPADILVGLTRVNGVAASILRNLGVTEAIIRQQEATMPKDAA